MVPSRTSWEGMSRTTHGVDGSRPKAPGTASSARRSADSAASRTSWEVLKRSAGSSRRRAKISASSVVPSACPAISRYSCARSATASRPISWRSAGSAAMEVPRSTATRYTRSPSGSHDTPLRSWAGRPRRPRRRGSRGRPATRAARRRPAPPEPRRASGRPGARPTPWAARDPAAGRRRPVQRGSRRSGARPAPPPWPPACARARRPRGGARPPGRGRRPHGGNASRAPRRARARAASGSRTPPAAPPAARRSSARR